MKMQLFAVAVGALLLSSAAWAHHASSIYDSNKPVTFKGVVVELQFINPHVQVVFETVRDNGAKEIWKAGSAPPQRLYRAGWNAKTLQPGDEITVTCSPAKDGTKICSIIKLVGPGGKVLTQGAG